MVSHLTVLLMCDRRATAGNIVFYASWADVVIIGICNSVQLLFGQDVHR